MAIEASSTAGNGKNRRYLDLVLSAKELSKKQYDRWLRSVRMYRGELTDFRSKLRPEWAHVIEVNLTRPTIDTMLPNIIFQNPKVMVRPSYEMAGQQDQLGALTIENDINAVQMEMKLSREAKRATKDSLLCGVGWLKVGFSHETSDDQSKQQIPFLCRVSPWEMHVDPACREHSLSDASYLVHETTVSLDNIKNDPTLDPKKRQNVAATGIMDTLPEHVKESRGTKITPYEYATIYELWLRDEQLLVVLDRDGNILRKDPWPYKIGAPFPFVPIIFNQIPDEFYCPGEPEYLYYLTLEISERRTQLLNHTRRFNRKYAVPLDVADDDLNALKSGEDGTIVRTNGNIVPIADANLPTDVMAEYDKVQSEARDVSGITAYQRGGGEKGVYSATEAKIIDSAASIRVRERQEEVAWAITVISEIIYDVMAPTKGWPDRRYRFVVDIATMLRPDDEGKRQQLLNMAQILGQYPEFKRVQLMRDVAVSFHKPPEQYVLSDEEIQQQQSQPSPEQQKMQMEQQKMQMQMQLEQQKGQMALQSTQADLEVKKTEAQIDMQVAQVELEIKKQELQLKMQELQLKREELMMKKEEMVLGAQMNEHKMRIEAQNADKQQEVKDADLRRQMQERTLKGSVSEKKRD